MPKNTQNAALSAKPARVMTTKTLAYCALLAALQVVLARLIVPMPAADTRFSIEAVPVLMAGCLFGPVPGALVGFSADLIGCLFSGYGYNPIFALPPILYGVCGGLFRWYLSKGASYLRVLISYLPPVILGSVLYQSCTLAYIYNAEGAFLPSLKLQLIKRSIQFALTIFVDAAVTCLLFKSKIFQRAGVWPPVSKKRTQEPEA